jgi:phosphocarrier protein FPr/phosphocarrier protein
LSELTLLAPLQGWIAPLEETPDAVFAEKMMGDGLAIDPTGASLHAPCAGEIIALHHSRHAVSLRAPNGAEILMHIGLETVALNGAGFTAYVQVGQTVAPGDKLVSFDLDFVARRAKSLISPIVITNGEAFVVGRREVGRLVEIGGAFMTVRPAAEAAAAEPEAVIGDDAAQASRAFAVPLAHGLHARPAAALAAAAKGFAADIRLAAAGQSANAKSPVAVMALGVRRGDQIVLSASGADAQAAVDALAALILTDTDDAPPQRRASPAAQPAGVPSRLKGVTAAPGLAIGVAARLVAAEIHVDEDGKGVEAETAALNAALAEVKAHIETLAATGPRQQQAILGAHIAFLEDAELAAEARKRIRSGKSAGAAWRGAVEGYVGMLRGVGDARLRERVDDLIDLERQVLLALSGETEAAPTFADGAILVADDLLPSQLLRLDATRLGGVCTARGGPTSHVAILAAARNLPMVVALGAQALAIPNGAPLILNADTAEVEISPSAEALAAAQNALAERRVRREAAWAAAQEPCRLADGGRVEVLANVGSEADAKAAREAGAEFLFLDRATAPSEDEQLQAYQAIADALDGRPMVIRTLDVGGDKPVSYLPIAPEENPALGLRGVRVSLARPDLLRTQLRAILRVASKTTRKIMAPMVASLSEFAAFKAAVLSACEELDVSPPPVGIMVETPAAAITADLLCAEADFISIGTNDLAQYVLAMDRGNALLAAEVDGLHPAVLRMIAEAVKGARAHGRSVSVCGGLASDLTAAPILLGLGVMELSASAAIVPELKALIRTLSAADCASLAEQALTQPSAAAVRALPIPKSRPKTLGRGAA